MIYAVNIAQIEYCFINHCNTGILDMV